MTFHAACGSKVGVLAHAAQLEEQCVLCVAFAAAEVLEVERRRPTPPVPRPVRELVADVVPLRLVRALPAPTLETAAC